MYSFFQVLNFLLDYEPNLFGTPSNPISALELACEKGRSQIVTCLLKHMGKQTLLGHPDTSLLKAILSNSVKVVELLLEYVPILFMTDVLLEQDCHQRLQDILRASFLLPGKETSRS